MKKNKKGFSVVEILLILAVIGILATAILVNIFSAKLKSQNMSVFYSMRGTADVSFACIVNQLPGVSLSSFSSSVYNSICIYNSGAGYVDAPGYPDWPEISDKGWKTDLKNSLGDDGFYWCSVFSAGESHPTNVGAYQEGVYGGSATSGNFCYMLKKGNNYIWCTQEGCRKEGF